MAFWLTSLNKLQRAWYECLKLEGFEDAEEIVGKKVVLRQSATHPYRHTESVAKAAKEEYFRFLSKQIHEAEFRSDVDRLILTKRANGEKIKNICEALEKQGDRRCRNTIRFTIRRYEMQWGLRNYTLKQLNMRELR